MSAQPYPFGNGVRPLCCDREPMLRRYVNTIAIGFSILGYQCRACGHSGNKNDHDDPKSAEAEARASWQRLTPGPLTL